MLMKLHKQKLEGLGKNENWRMVKKIVVVDWPVLFLFDLRFGRIDVLLWSYFLLWFDLFSGLFCLLPTRLLIGFVCLLPICGYFHIV